MKYIPQIALSLLLLAGAAAAQTTERSYSKFPTGEGAPDAITCRPPEPIPDSRLDGPEVCKKNSVWAQYRRDGMDVAPDGIHDVRLSGKSGINCQSAAVAGGGTGGNMRMDMHCN